MKTPSISPIIRPLFGARRHVLNKSQAVREGYRVFRAVHSCGCCYVHMAFLSLHNASVQFDTPKFADTVRDDMGVVHECVNTNRGFREVKSRETPKRVMAVGPVPQRRPIAPQSTRGQEAPL